MWKRADSSLDDLAGDLLDEDLVATLDREGPRRWPRNGDDVQPYLHQLRAWKSSDEGRSFLVTSGTGSGKTECFVIPMLNDLLRKAKGQRRKGVQAIVLYPLNALIDSQKERLNAWIDPLYDRLTVFRAALTQPMKVMRFISVCRDRAALRGYGRRATLVRKRRFRSRLKRAHQEGSCPFRDFEAPGAGTSGLS